MSAMTTGAPSHEHIMTTLDPTQNIVGFNYPFAKALLEKLESLIEERRPIGSVGEMAYVVTNHLHRQIFQQDSSGYYSVSELETLASTAKDFLAIFEKKRAKRIKIT